MLPHPAAGTFGREQGGERRDVEERGAARLSVSLPLTGNSHDGDPRLVQVGQRLHYRVSESAVA